MYSMPERSITPSKLRNQKFACSRYCSSKCRTIADSFPVERPIIDESINCFSSSLYLPTDHSLNHLTGTGQRASDASETKNQASHGPDLHLTTASPDSQHMSGLRTLDTQEPSPKSPDSGYQSGSHTQPSPQHSMSAPRGSECYRVAVDVRMTTRGYIYDRCFLVCSAHTCVPVCVCTRIYA